MFRSIPILIRYRVSATVALTTLPGYVLYAHTIDLKATLVLIGVYLLASSATALNQIQERERDALMERTRNRPLPAKNISLGAAYCISSILGITGCVLLFLYGGLVPLFLGLFNIIWYNGLYTNLKKITAFAVVPGSLAGALPPVIGWTAAGGSLFSHQIIILSACIFLWQIPHFWLLQLRHTDDYRRAGYPVLADKLSDAAIKNITAAWVLAYASSMGLFIIYRIVYSPVSRILSGLVIIALCVMAVITLLQRDTVKSNKWLFVFINLCMIIIMAVVFWDNLKVMK